MPRHLYYFNKAYLPEKCIRFYQNKDKKAHRLHSWLLMISFPTTKLVYVYGRIREQMRKFENIDKKSS